MPMVTHAPIRQKLPHIAIPDVKTTKKNNKSQIFIISGFALNLNPFWYTDY